MLRKPRHEIITFYRLKKLLFTQFLIVIRPTHFTPSLRGVREPSCTQKSTSNLGKKAVPQRALSSGGPCRCYSMLDPHPTKNPPQHYCILLLSRWPLTAGWLSLVTGCLHSTLVPTDTADELFRFWLSALIFYPLFNNTCQAQEGDGWLS